MAKQGRRRIWLWLVGALLLLVLAALMTFVLWLRSDDFQRRATAIATQVLSSQTGEVATVEQVRVRFWPPSIRADGVALHTADGREIATLEHVRAPLALQGGSVGIGRLQLVEPTLSLHLDEKGRLLEFQGAPRGGGGLQRLPWRSLEITEGRVRIEHPEGTVELTAIEATPVQGPITDLSATLSLQARGLEDGAEVHLDQITLGPEVIEIPAATIELATARLGLSGTVPLQGDLDLDATVHVWLDELQPLLDEPRAVHGVLDADVHVVGPPDDVDVDFAVLATGFGFDVPGARVPLLSYDLGTITAAGTASADGVTVESIGMDWGGGRLTGTARLTPDLRLEDARVVGEGLSMARILQQASAAPTPWVDFRGDLEATASGTLQPLDLTGTFDLAVADLVVAGSPVANPDAWHALEYATATASGTHHITKDLVTLNATAIEGLHNRGSVTAAFGTGPNGIIDINLDMRHADLSDFRPLSGSRLFGRGRITGRIWGTFGSVQLAGHGRLRDFSVTGIPYADLLDADLYSPAMQTLELRNTVATKGNTTYTGDLLLNFRSPFSIDTDVVVTDGRVEDLIGMFLDLPGLEGDLSGTLSLRGPINDLDGECDLKLADVDLWGERFITGRALGTMRQGVFTLDDLSVTRAGGTAGLMLRGSVGRAWALNMELLGDGFRLERMDWLAPAALPLTGRASLAVRIGNTLFDPAPEGWVSVSEVRYSGQRVGDSLVRFSTTDGVLTGRGNLAGGTISADATLGLWGNQPYSLGARFDKFPAHVLYPRGADGSPVHATLTGELVMDGAFGAEPTPPHLEVTAREVALRWGRHDLRNTEPWVYQQDGNRYALYGFALAGGDTSFRFSAAGEGRKFSAQGHGQLDLDLLRAVVPGLSRSEGIAYADLSVDPNTRDGPRVDLDIHGELVRHDSFPAAFEDLRARVVATRDGFVLKQVNAKLGGGDITGSGTIGAEDWYPVWFDLSGAATDCQLQWVDYLPPVIGDADISFHGPASDPLLSGDLRIHDMTWTDRIDWEDWVVEWRDGLLVDYTPVDEEPLFSMDFHLGADRTVRFRNNVAEGTASADLRVVGTTSRPGLQGRAWFDDALVFLQDREFHVERGELDFNDPWTWDPDLDIDLITDITSRDQRYHVNYVIRGPFSNWTTTTRSDPPLAQADINALLWFGVTTEDLEEMGELPGAITQGVLDMVLTDIVIGRTGEAREELQVVFDRMDVVTGVDVRGEYSSDPRLLISRRFDELGDIEATWEMNLFRPDDQYLRVERRLSDTWSFSAWYATIPRDRTFLDAALGLDVRAQMEVE